MQIVIKISEEDFQSIKENASLPFSTLSEKIIANGTPLPKGHGRLIDEKDLSLMAIRMIGETVVCDVPTILEADKEITDAIKALFPKIDDNFSNVIDLKLWWSSKYKAGEEE